MGKLQIKCVCVPPGQEGVLQCQPLLCPVLTCQFTVLAKGECCLRCADQPCLTPDPGLISDPSLTSNPGLTSDLQQTCLDAGGMRRFSEDTWRLEGSTCTTCKCQVGHRSEKTLATCR